MSQYHYTSGKWTLVVGYDAPLATFFAQVWPKDKQVQHPIFWSGADGKHVSLEELRKQVEPYGTLPLLLQARLLQDQESRHPLPFPDICQSIVEISSQASEAQLRGTDFTISEPSYVLINQDGWQVYPFRFANLGDAREVFSRQIYGNIAVLPRTEEVGEYLSDRSIVVHVAEEGMLDQLPLYAGVTKRGGQPGVLLSGPVIIAGEQGGLREEQVSVVRQEVFFVHEEIRKVITDLWYQAWKTRVFRLQKY